MALHDIAEHSGATLQLEEDALPQDDARDGACELLGLDPLHLPCEGRFLIILPESMASDALEVLQSFEASRAAAIVGQVAERGKYPVELQTALGTRRVLTPPRGEQLPRIC